MALRDRLRDLAGDAESDVVGLFDRWQGGGLTETEFVRAAAAAIARANARAIRTADRAAAIQLSRLLRREVEPLADDVDDPRDRLTDSVSTVLAEDPDIAETPQELAESRRRRLGRLARNEPLERGSEAFAAALVASRVGWTRATGPDACPLCETWDDGQVRPAYVSMPRHPNCSCVRRPARL